MFGVYIQLKRNHLWAGPNKVVHPSRAAIWDQDCSILTNADKNALLSLLVYLLEQKDRNLRKEVFHVLDALYPFPLNEEAVVAE